MSSDDTAVAPPTIAVADDPLFDEHVAPAEHPERPARLKGARAGLQGSVFAQTAVRLKPRDASFDELARAHDNEYISRLAGIKGHAGFLDADTFYSTRSAEATMRATGAALALVDSLLAGQCDYGMTLSRPPGHHARPGTGMGFCLLNHAAVAAHHALAHGASRVLVLDWDVHHGNGTEEIFESDPRVLYVSLHQSPQYPGTGAVGDVGLGEGRGATVNIPLSAGAGNCAYRAAFERLVLPIVEQFSPDCTLVSAGYDAHAQDPLGGMQLDAAGFGMMTRMLADTLRELRKPRIGFLLEGGYNVAALQHSVTATLDALVQLPESLAREVLEARHEQELAAAIRIQRQYFKL